MLYQNWNKVIVKKLLLFVTVKTLMECSDVGVKQIPRIEMVKLEVWNKK